MAAEVTILVLREPGADAALPLPEYQTAGSLHIALSLHKQFQLFFQFLPRYAVALKYVEQVSRCERQLLVEQEFYLAFFVLLGLAFSKHLPQ